MSRLDEVGDADGWRCWICDEAVDRQMSVNDARGPSVDSVTSRSKGKVAAAGGERLAHRSCNTKKGAIAAVVSWPPQLFVIDPAPIVGTVERLRRKGGRVIVARCPTRVDAEEAAAWLLDRISRLSRDLAVTAEIESGGGQFVVGLRAGG